MLRAPLVMLACASGCSLVLEFDPQGQPCNGNACLPGYYCVGTQCFRAGSQPVGENCQRYEEVCESGLLCRGNQPLVCAEPCGDDEHYQSGRCSEGYYCHPDRRPQDPQNVPPRSMCYESACDPDTNSGCDPDEECVQVGYLNKESACVQRCRYSVNSAGTFEAHDCGLEGRDETCVPLGVRGSEELGCIQLGPEENVIKDPVTGQACRLTDMMCARGWACLPPPGAASAVERQCFKICNPAPGAVSGCETNEECVPKGNGDRAYALCEPL